MGQAEGDENHFPVEMTKFASYLTICDKVYKKFVKYSTKYALFSKMINQRLKHADELTMKHVRGTMQFNYVLNDNI